MTSTRLSIVVTSYNQRAFIRDAVDSALSQAYANKDVVVVDDGSSDGSPELLRQYGETIRLVTLATNQGGNEARNLGAETASGDYLVFLDGDDVCLPWALDVYAQLIAERHPAVILGRVRSFKGAVPALSGEGPLQTISFADYRRTLVKDRRGPGTVSALVVERQAFWSVNGFSPNFYLLEPTNILTKLGCAGRTVWVDSPRTVLYRLHSGNSMLTVPPFLRDARSLIVREKAGEYGGGRHLRLQRWSWIGGKLLYWTRKAIRGRFYREAVGLVSSGWPMMLAAVLLRSAARIRGRVPIERIEFQSELADSTARATASGS